MQITEQYKFEQDEIVTFSYDFLIGVGMIKGVATTAMPVVGRMWIVEVFTHSCPQIPSDVYPFNTVCIPEHAIFKADKPNEG